MCLNIGVVGYSNQIFNKEKGKEILSKAFDTVINEHNGSPKVVSGLTNTGIPKLAYEEASSRGWGTIGIACEKANSFELYPVDEEYIVGTSWGDESEVFLSKIDILIRVGGGDQAYSEAKTAKYQKEIPVYEFDL